MAKFKNFIPKTCRCYRDGELKNTNAIELVRGDVVKVANGDNIPADLVMIDTQGDMKVDNSSLTGETEQLLRNADKSDKTTKLLESMRVAFSGTECKNGSGTGIVFGIADNTVIGAIANLAEQAESAETPLSIEIHRFILIVSAVAITLGVTFFLFGIAYGYDIITNLVFAIGIIVANVPEGLLATVTVSLALTAQRMSKKFVLVKNLESVETLGSTSCICSDKTGTLTQNVMTVSQLVYDNKRFDASINYSEFVNADLKKKFENRELGYHQEDKGFKALMRAIALSTTASFTYNLDDKVIKEEMARVGKPTGNAGDVAAFKKTFEDGLRAGVDTRKHVIGDASETGLVKFVNSVVGVGGVDGLDKERLEYPEHQSHNQKCNIPFNSAIKFNLSIRSMKNADAEEGIGMVGQRALSVYMKGAPERIIIRCSKILINGVEHELTDGHRSIIDQENADMGSDGERVLAFANYHLDPERYDNDYEFKMQYFKTYTAEDVANNNTSVPGYFPMHGLTFIGLVSLNDPPRFRVDHSVDKCRKAGIKVIMVTGDQKPTGAAIARKVNIITDLTQTVDALKESKMHDGPGGWTEKECFDRAKAVVVHGDELATKFKEEEHLPDDAPDKGRYLLDWIRKEEIVFARTSPSQKLQIVAACQRAGYVVAVTGDGVNDSPAIKKADIGVAMGSGSDVAKNAADMILLNDDFSSIVNGVEEGRLIFDNLKKSIAYTLSSNIPEISPFIMFILLQVPLPLSTVLILCIDLGTDMIPAISFAYENAELDIMERMPRNSKRDHLVNVKLISFAYLQIGMVQASAGFYTYFYILNDYGFRPQTLFFLSSQEGIFPESTDVYNPANDDASGVYGNSNAPGGKKEQLAWNLTKDGDVDARLFYYKEEPSSWVKCRWAPNDTDVPAFWRQSWITNNQICYTTEALKFAQGGYLISIVCVQWADLMICKCRSLSISQQGMVNKFGNFGLFFETALVAILSYVEALNIGLGTRHVAPPHFAVPSFTFFCVIMFYDEFRKNMLRAGVETTKDVETGLDQKKYVGWIAQNTYY